MTVVAATISYWAPWVAALTGVLSASGLAMDAYNIVMFFLFGKVYWMGNPLLKDSEKPQLE
jgi:hypothetical protein